MREKSKAILNMTDTFTRMENSRAESTKAALQSVSTPEQLWADSLVPHVINMSDGRKAQFMVHVLGLAFKANMGLWPSKEEDD